MARLPTRIQGVPFGVNNPAQGTSLRKAPPSILQPGPAQPLEQFSASANIHPEVARALNQIQTNVAQAVAQIKADPTSNKNVFEQITVVNGGTNGIAPFTPVSHGLGAAYRGYRVCTVRNGYVKGHAASTPTAEFPAAQYLLLWTDISAFGSAPVSIDLEVWA